MGGYPNSERMTNCKECNQEINEETKHLFIPLRHSKKGYLQDCKACLNLKKKARYAAKKKMLNVPNGLIYKTGTNLVTKVISYPPTL